jgi:carbohydrate diacid regulator
LANLGIAALVTVTEPAVREQLITRILTPLDKEPVLMETLQAFFAQECSPSNTAKRLFIHRNTLSYRLNQITDLTGLDPRIFGQAVQLRLALLLRTLKQHPLL